MGGAGGGVKRGEPWAAGARRELHEETGIDKPLEFRSFGSVSPQAMKTCILPLLSLLSCEKYELPPELYNPREIVGNWLVLARCCQTTQNELVPLPLERAKQGRRLSSR